MNLIESIVSSFSTVLSHKMRSLLTMLGIIIGISSVITISALGTGVQDKVFEEISVLNTAMVQVMPMEWGLTTLDDVDALKQINNVSYVAPEASVYGATTMSYLNEEIQGQLGGIVEDYRQTENFTMAAGRFITDNDVANTSMVIVLTEARALEIFGRTDIVGEKMTITTWSGDHKFTIVGIVKSPEGGLGAVNTTLTYTLGVIPITTSNYLSNVDRDMVDLFVIVLENSAYSEESSKAITDFLNKKYQREDRFYAYSLAAEIDGIETMLGGIQAFIILVAAISLLVGGIGVMNIMLVTVTERTREIGIRKSLGATEGNIKFQFLVESMILTFIGGAIGVLVGVSNAKIIGILIQTFSGISIMPVANASSIGIAFFVSILIGIFFGVYPAGKAAKLNPIESLRYE